MIGRPSGSLMDPVLLLIYYHTIILYNKLGLTLKQFLMSHVRKCFPIANSGKK